MLINNTFILWLNRTISVADFFFKQEIISFEDPNWQFNSLTNSWLYPLVVKAHGHSVDPDSEMARWNSPVLTKT